MGIWWCSQSKGWAIERPAGVVCASDHAHVLTYRQRVEDARRGDVVVHYKSPFVVAFSQARTDGRYFGKLPHVSDEDYGSGWGFETDYFDLNAPIHRDAFGKDLVRFIVKHYPINKDGNPRQGYFFPFDRRSLAVVLSKSEEPRPQWLERFGG